MLPHRLRQLKRFGAPLDLMFQSIAGSQKGNEAFGLTAAMLEEGRQTMLTNSTATGPERYVLRDRPGI